MIFAKALPIILKAQKWKLKIRHRKERKNLMRQKREADNAAS